MCKAQGMEKTASKKYGNLFDGTIDCVSILNLVSIFNHPSQPSFVRCVIYILYVSCNSNCHNVKAL